MRHNQYINYKTFLEEVAQGGTTEPRAGSTRKNTIFLEVAQVAQLHNGTTNTFTIKPF